MRDVFRTENAGGLYGSFSEEDAGGVHRRSAAGKADGGVQDKESRFPGVSQDITETDHLSAVKAVVACREGYFCSSCTGCSGFV